MSFSRLCFHLLLMTGCLLLAGSSLHGESGFSVPREEDERAATIEQRQQALTELRSAADRYREAGDLAQAAALMNRVARVQVLLHKPEDARNTFKEVFILTREATGSPARIDSLNGSAAIDAELSHCVQSEAAARQAIALSEETGYVAGHAEALMVLSDCQNHQDHALALNTAQEALRLWQSANSKWGMAKTYEAIGQYQLSQNQLEQSAESHQLALNLWRELGIQAQQAESYINLGFIEYRRGAWQDSMSLLSQAQGLLDEKAEPFKMGQIAGGLAEAFIEIGLPETALTKLKLATEYFRSAGVPRAVLSMSWDTGRAHYLLGNYAEAIKSLEEGAAGGNALQEPVLAALCHEHLGRTYSAMNDFDGALIHYQRALEQFRQTSSPMEAARTRALMGQLYQRQGKLQTGRRYYQRALAEFRTLQDRLNEAATLYAIGTLELQEDNLDLAAAYLQQSISATETMRRVSTSNDLAAAFSATVHERYQAYIDSLMRKNQRQGAGNFAVQAFETSERARARSLTEFLRATQTNLVSGLNAGLAEKDKSLRQALRVKEDDKVALLSREYRKEELETLEADMKRLEGESQQVTEEIRSHYPSYEQITRPTDLDLRQIQEQVVRDDDTLLLEYSLGANRSYVWAVTRSAITSYELPAQAVIDVPALRIRDLMANPPTEESEKNLSEAIEQLGQTIISPIAASLTKPNVIVVADGSLNYVPFQLLRAPSNRDEPLISSFQIVNAPSASILAQLRHEAAQRARPARALAAFGDPVFASNFDIRKAESSAEQIAATKEFESQRQQTVRDMELNPDSVDWARIQPLFYARFELNYLRQIGGTGSLIATGFDATRQNLSTIDLSKFSILHFATHGLLNTRRPELSGLMLSSLTREKQDQNGFVSLQDIYSLRAPVDLVVMSACRTGLGKEVRGEGLIGLTRGFMYAGASSVVASLWKVDDEATTELMKLFYDNMLQKGMKPAEALRAAQNSIRSEPQWRSPYYWAAFTLQGEYQQPLKLAPGKTGLTRSIGLWLGLFVGLAVIAAALFFYRRTRAAQRTIQ